MRGAGSRSRLEADVLLAAGQWQQAIEAYTGLLAGTRDSRSRAELLLGLAEAEVRLDHGVAGAQAAREAAELFLRQGRAEEEALARYWLAGALYLQDNAREARTIVQSLLGRVRTGQRVEPAFKMRLLLALATAEARDDNHHRALSYLTEVRGLADSLDYRRRGNFYFHLSYSYGATGDYEAALRAGYTARELFVAAGADIDVASTDNDLALHHLATGNVRKAAALAGGARASAEKLGDERLLSHVIETQAQIEAAQGNWSAALQLTAAAIERSRRASNQKTQVSALLTAARAHAALGAPERALAAYADAAEIARRIRRPALVRRVLAAWAEALAEGGDHRRAFELQREALSLTS